MRYLFLGATWPVCGIAGFAIEEIAPLFADAVDVENIILPKEFESVIHGMAGCPTSCGAFYLPFKEEFLLGL